MSTRLIVGAAAGGAAVATGVLAGRAGHDHFFDKVESEGRTPVLDSTGIPGGIPDVTALAAIAGVGALTMLLSRRVSGGASLAKAAAIALPAGAALGATAGWFIGRRHGIIEGQKTEAYAANREARFAGKRARSEEIAKQREADHAAEATASWQREFGVSGTTMSGDDVFRQFTRRYDHDGDGTINLRPGQPMVADERVAVERRFGLGGGGAPTDDDDRVRTHLSDLLGLDGNDDGILTRDEAVEALLARHDADGDGRLSMDEYAQLPKGNALGDYNDLEQ